MAAIGRVAGALLLSCSIPLMAGCGSKPPIIHVNEIVVEGESPEATRLGVSVTLENPNDNELSLGIWEYRVTADRRFDGMRRALFTLPPKATVPTVLPAITGTPGPGSEVRVEGVLHYFGRGDIEYALYRAGWIDPTASFQGRAIAPAN